MAASNGRHSESAAQDCEEPLCLRYGENRNRFVNLACLVDMLGGIAIAPSAFTGPSKEGSKMTDRRVATRGSLVFGEMTADVLLGNLVDNYFRRKLFRQQAQKGLIADNSLFGCAAVFLSRQEAPDGIREGDRSRFRSKVLQAQLHRVGEREPRSFELSKTRDCLAEL